MSVWVRLIVEVLLPHSDGLPRQRVIAEVAKLRAKEGYKLPRDINRAVQSAFDGHHEASSTFGRRNRSQSDAFFYPVGGKHSGRWGIDPQKAADWLRTNSN